MDSPARNRFPPAGLIGYWFANEDVAKLGTWLNRSGNGNDMALYADANVVGGDRCIFDGTGDYGKVLSVNLASLDAFTLGAWIRDLPQSAASQIFEHSTNFNSNSGAFMVAVNDRTGKISCSAIYGGGYNEYTIPRWTGTGYHHLAVVFKKCTAGNPVAQAYVDGVAQTMTAVLTSAISAFRNDTMYVASRGGASRYTACGMDGIFLYNRALDAAEINSIYLRTKKV